MKKATALVLTLGMAFTATTGKAEQPAPSLKITSEWYNVGVCKPAVIKFHQDVKQALINFNATKLLRPEAREYNPDIYENLVRDGDVLHMAAFGVDRYVDSEVNDLFNKPNNVLPGTAEDRAGAENFFCGNVYGYSSALARAVAMQNPVHVPDEKEIVAGQNNATAPLRVSSTRFNVAACPADTLAHFRDVTGKVIPNPHPLQDEEEMTREKALAYEGAQIRTAMIRSAQAGLTGAASFYVEHLAKKQSLDDASAHKAFCNVVESYSQSLEYFFAKHMDYSMPKKGPETAPGGPTL